MAEFQTHLDLNPVVGLLFTLVVLYFLTTVLMPLFAGLRTLIKPD